MTAKRYAPYLAQRFGLDWDSLTLEQRVKVLADFAELVRDEYDAPDPTMPEGIEAENVLEASREYRRRIGRGNLASYADCLRGE